MELTLRLFLCPFKKARRFLDCHFCILAASLIAIIWSTVLSPTLVSRQRIVGAQSPTEHTQQRFKVKEAGD
jgi:hypothetical protein